MSFGTVEVGGGAFIAFARGSVAKHFSGETPEGEVAWSEEGSWLPVLRKDGGETRASLENPPPHVEFGPALHAGGAA